MNSVYVDNENGFNDEITDLFGYALSEAPPSFVSYFERCVEGLNPDGKGLFRGYPVYANPETGIIMAAVIGACGIALRVSQTKRPKLLQAGARETIQVENAKYRLGSPNGDIWEGWLVTEGGLNPDEVRQALLELHPVLARARAKQIERKGLRTQPGPLEQPANTQVLTYLKALPPGAGSSHPEFAEDFFQNVPRNAGIDPAGVTGTWVNRWPVLMHRASGVIFGFYDAAYALVLRVPAAVHRAALQTMNSKGEPTAMLFPEAGPEWIRCSLAAVRENPQWLASAYQSAETIQNR